MKKKTKATILLMILGLITLIITGCSGGSSTADYEQAQEPEAATTVVRDLETAVINDETELLADNITEDGVSVNISGERKIYKKNDSAKLINDIKTEVNTEKFNLINRETNLEKKSMIISAEVIESYSPTNDFSNSVNTSLTSNEIKSQYSSDHFQINTPENWEENSLSVDESNIALYSAYSLNKDEGVSVIYLNLNNDADFDLSEITSETVEKYFNDKSAKLEDLGIYNLNIKNTEDKEVDNKQAVRINGSFNTEYRLFELVLEYKKINDEYFLYNISIEKKNKSESTIERKEAAYLINDDNNLVIVDYVADSSQFNEENLQKIIGSFKTN